MEQSGVLVRTIDHIIDNSQENTGQIRDLKRNLLEKKYFSFKFFCAKYQVRLFNSIFIFWLKRNSSLLQKSITHIAAIDKLCYDFDFIIFLNLNSNIKTRSQKHTLCNEKKKIGLSEKQIIKQFFKKNKFINYNIFN